MSPYWQNGWSGFSIHTVLVCSQFLKQIVLLFVLNCYLLCTIHTRTKGQKPLLNEFSNGLGHSVFVDLRDSCFGPKSLRYVSSSGMKGINLEETALLIDRQKCWTDGCRDRLRCPCAQFEILYFTDIKGIPRNHPTYTRGPFKKHGYKFKIKEALCDVLRLASETMQLHGVNSLPGRFWHRYQALSNE